MVSECIFPHFLSCQTEIFFWFSSVFFIFLVAHGFRSVKCTIFFICTKCTIFFLTSKWKSWFNLTSQPLTSLENYMTWARSVFLTLSLRNKFGFVNGSISKPALTSPLFNSWNRCNATILSWLTNSLSLDLKASVIYINFAKDLWIDLKNRLS